MTQLRWFVLTTLVVCPDFAKHVHTSALKSYFVNSATWSFSVGHLFSHDARQSGSKKVMCVSSLNNEMLCMHTVRPDAFMNREKDLIFCVNSMTPIAICAFRYVTCTHTWSEDALFCTHRKTRVCSNCTHFLCSSFHEPPLEHQMTAVNGLFDIVLQTLELEDLQWLALLFDNSVTFNNDSMQLITG